MGYPRDWQPILDDTMYAEANQVIDRIASNLGSCPSPETDDRAAASRPVGSAASLMHGYAGRAIFYAYLANYKSDKHHVTTATTLMERALDGVSETDMGWDFYDGIPGVAWVLTHLRNAIPIDGEDDPNAVVDESLLHVLSADKWKGPYDLVSGLVGFGVYALERHPIRAGTRCLERVIDLLDGAAEHTSEGITWRTPSAILDNIDKSFTRRNRPIPASSPYNLGVAHGIPGIIALLGRAYAAGIAIGQVGPLLEGAVDWLLAQRLPGGTTSSFSSFARHGGCLEPARSAWCYGDPGIAACLLLAARCVGNVKWEEEAVAIARGAALRPSDQTRIQDAGLCHGAAGLGHIYNRLYQATDQPDFLEAARFWFRWTLGFQRHLPETRDFPAWSTTEAGIGYWEDDPGVLSGVAGVGLAFLAATTSDEPEWDRILLLSASSKQT